MVRSQGSLHYNPTRGISFLLRNIKGSTLSSQLLHGGKTHASHLFFAQNQFAGIHSSDISRIHFRVRQALDSVAALRLRLRLRHALLFIVFVFCGMIIVDAEGIAPERYLLQLFDVSRVLPRVIHGAVSKFDTIG